jgi:hypothetical protein
MRLDVKLNSPVPNWERRSTHSFAQMCSTFEQTSKKQKLSIDQNARHISKWGMEYQVTAKLHDEVHHLLTPLAIIYAEMSGFFLLS